MAVMVFQGLPLLEFSTGSLCWDIVFLDRFVVWILWLLRIYIIYIIYGCGSKCKGLDQAPVPHTIQTSDPDLSKGFDPDL